MCFSATASFTASAALGVIGVASIVKVKNKRELPLAIVPLIFALQQFLEGLLWLSISGFPHFTLPLTYVYLFFAFLWWPIYTPFVVYFLATRAWQKKIIAVIFAGGILAGIWFYSLFILHPLSAQIVNKCVYYSAEAGSKIVPAVLYLVAIIIPGFLLKKRIANIFSFIVGVSALIAWWFYTVNFASVWCFFSAVLSFLIYFYISRKKKHD